MFPSSLSEVENLVSVVIRTFRGLVTHTLTLPRSASRALEEKIDVLSSMQILCRYEQRARVNECGAAVFGAMS